MTANFFLLGIFGLAAFALAGAFEETKQDDAWKRTVLEAILEKAVETEEYELAAVVRDRLAEE